MSDPAEPRLGDFLAAAGSGLAAAQSDLVGPLGDVPTAMALAEAELEVKATLSSGPDGTVGLRPVSAAQLAKGSVPVGLVSTVRVRFVPVTDGAPATPAPRRDRAAVIAEGRGREDLQRLEKILGALTYDASYVAERRAWVVEAVTVEGRTVRTLVVPDEEA